MAETPKKNLKERLGIMNALGYDEKELNSKPLIGIACSLNEVNPGHAHLLWLAEAVKYGIIESGFRCYSIR